MMMEREAQLPDQLLQGNKNQATKPRHEYAMEMEEMLQWVHEALRCQQREIRSAKNEEPPLFQPGEKVVMINHKRRQGEMGKLQPKFIGQYLIQEAYANHTCRLEHKGRQTIQSEGRLKPFTYCPITTGQVPKRVEYCSQLQKRLAAPRLPKPKATHTP